MGLSDHDRSVLERLEKHGWFVNKIAGDERTPQFAYSFGLYERWQHPELILFGLDLNAMHTIVNDAGEKIRNGVRYIDGDITSDLFNEYPCAFRRVDPAWYPTTLSWAAWYYASADFPALQLVWPDRRGRFPWEAQFDRKMLHMQPDLSVPPPAARPDH
jgi:hypothetical protein